MMKKEGGKIEEPIKTPRGAIRRIEYLEITRGTFGS